MGGMKDPVGRRRAAGFSQISAALGVALSALALSAVYAVVTSPARDERSLRPRVDLHLDAARTMRELAGLLRNSVSLGTSGPGRSFDYRQGPDSFAIVLSGGELHLRRAGDSAPARIVGRHVEDVEFSAEGDRLRIAVGFRREVDGKVYAIRRTCTVALSACALE